MSTPGWAAENTRNLHETFRAYVAAEAAATKAFIGYKFGEVSESEVHRLQRLEREAAAVHIAAINGASS